MAKLGFAQSSSMPNNQAAPNSQAMPGYNLNQATPAGMAPSHNSGAPAQHGNMAMVNGNWMSQGNFPQQPPVPQYLTTGPTAAGFNMYQAQSGLPSGQTLSNSLWK